MPARPSEYLNWTPGAPSDKVVEPPSGQKTSGWVVGEKPPARYFNWIINLIDQWIQYFDANIGSNFVTTEYDITDGQSATDLNNGTDIEQFDGTVDSSVEYIYQIVRGTTVMASGTFSFQYFNTNWVVAMGEERSAMPDTVNTGVTLTPRQVGSVGTIQAAATSGAGNGTIRLKKVSFPAS